MVRNECFDGLAGYEKADGMSFADGGQVAESFSGQFTWCERLNRC